MNKLNRFRTVALAAVLAMAVAVSVATAQSTGTGEGGKKGRHGHFGQRGGRGGMMSFRNLDLTDAQKAQMKQIHENHRQAVAPLMKEIRAKRQEIRQASEGGNYNEALVAQKLAEIAPLEAKLMGERARIHQETMAVLTPEQKAKLDQAREQFKSRWTERRANKKQKSN